MSARSQPLRLARAHAAGPARAGVAGRGRRTAVAALLSAVAVLLAGPRPALAQTGVASATTGAATATASSLISLGSSSSSTPLISVSVPGLSSPETPLISVSVPKVEVSGTGISVSTPSVNVSAPGVNVSVPSVGVSTSPTPSVTVGETTVTTGGGESKSTGTSTTGTTSTSSTPSESSTPTGGSQTYTTLHQPEAGGGSAKAAATSPSAGSTAAGTAQSARSGAAAQLHRKRAGASPSKHTGKRRDAAGVSKAATALAPASATSATRAGAPATTHSAAKGSDSNPLDSVGKHIPLPIPVPDWSKPIILLLLLLAAWFAVRSRMAARRARRLERQRAGLLRDVGFMQAALVPDVPERVGTLGVSVAYRPAEGPAAGGDFYDVFVPEPGKVAIILGDIAGHGHEALKNAALTRYTLRAYLQAGLQPREALALAGNVLADPEVELFATVAVAVFDEHDGTLTYALAGHPPPIVLGQSTREHALQCSSPPIGWTAPTGRRQTTMSLLAGTRVCFFSDGLIEARRGEELLGRERLTELLTSLGADADASGLLASIRTEASATPDDMAACIIAPSSKPATFTCVEELEVDERSLAESAGASESRAGEFLAAHGLTPGEIAQTLERARKIAAANGTALLRIDMVANRVTVAARQPSTGRPPVVPTVPNEPVVPAPPALAAG